MNLLGGFVLAALAQGGPELPVVLLEEVSETGAGASLGDLDGDGTLDIVLAKGRHWPLANRILFGDGEGGFARRGLVGGAPDRTYTAALGDLDGDGDLDLAVGNDRPDEKRLYANDGEGRFRLVGAFGDSDWPTRNITLADLNGDGRPDIVVANRGGPEDRSSNHLCRNDGRGGFPACEALSGESATTIAAGDLDGDGSVDLFAPHRDGGQSYLFLNDGAGGFGQRHPVGPPRWATRAVTLADLDGDGRIDLVVGDSLGGGVFWFRNLGGASFAAARRIGASNDEAYALAAADLDGDGDTDVVVGNAGAPGAVLANEGGGARFSETRFGDREGAVYGLALGDLNRDGALDIVAGRSNAPSFAVFGSPSPLDGGPNRLRDPFRPLSRGGRTLPGGASRRVAREGLRPQSVSGTPRFRGRRE